MNITAQTSNQIEKLHQAYLKLNEYEQVVLKVLAVVYKPIGVTKLNSLLTDIGRANIFDCNMRIKGLVAEHREQLISLGFIAQNKSGILLNPLLTNKLASECAEHNTYHACVRFIEKIMPVRTVNPWQRFEHDYLALARDGYFMDDDIEPILKFHKNPQIIDYIQGKLLVELYFLPFDLEAFLTLSHQLQYQSFAAWFHLNNEVGFSHEYLLLLLEQVLAKNPDNIHLKHLCGELYLNTLRFDDLRRIVAQDDATCYGLQINAALLVLQSEFEQADELFKKAIVAKNKYARRKRQYLAGNFGVLYKLCLFALAAQDTRYYDALHAQLGAEESDKNTDYGQKYIISLLWRLTNSLSSGDVYSVTAYLPESFRENTPFIYYLYTLLCYLGGVWCGEQFTKELPVLLARCAEFFTGGDRHIFAHISQQISDHVLLKQPQLKSTKTRFKIEGSNTHIPKIPHFPSLVSRKAEWDIALEKLIALNPSTPCEIIETKAQKPTRIIWEMTGDLTAPAFRAREQKQTSKGWSKGRTVALKRLAKEHENLTHLTDADKEMCGLIEVYQSWDYYQTKEYRLGGKHALAAAKNVDYLCLAGEYDQRIELHQKEPELLIREQQGQLLLSMADLPAFLGGGNDFTLKQTSTHGYTFTLFSEAHLKVANIIGEGGLMIPVAAKNKVLQSVAAIAPLLNIQSDITELDTGLETKQCDNHLVINIQPFGEGLDFTCMVMPFGDEGPAFKPMRGNVQITAELAGQRIATQRDLHHEQVLLETLEKQCPQFATIKDNTLALDDPQAALEVLEQLENIISQTPMPFLLRLRWPKGKKINLTKTLSGQHLSLAVGKSSEWFDLTGELKVNESQVIELQKLLALVSASSGRFVELDSGQVLALSHDLKERLELLHQATDGGKFHALASMQVAEATTGMRLKTIHAWDEQAKKMHESNSLTPTLPSTLQAELRDYQLEGFDWLSRLAHWKAGACLADDMGLGKTLQALALLLARAANGPSLVIAPTSVCFNWQQEALKFAPTLNIKLFSDFANTSAREDLLNSLAAFDCVIMSYGLLQRESDLLTKVQWHTIVADEAQALKNPLAKRTQAACALKGDFKIITTGTPIENNLTELWSLFRFITPGLLGSIKKFGERYALPIENIKDDKLAAKKASLALKALIQPFILRRLKSQVLTELPARTEINIHVELSRQEQDFYEALRRNAIDNIARASETANEGEQRIKMLAELVKLRQACCNPKLVMAETTLPSAKLAALNELLDELQNNHHKALIFSQFVGHLQLIKQHLDKRNISYQYLDGSTPQKSRKARVNAFQSGEGDVFLISLKAGGSGLNLTAADYVIHMDPWWNPAVEDQASDRAHRMGQKRPVTIYRLIAKNTIEERIVALHQHKRDLADKLLAGNEQATKLSVDDVLGMLKESFH